MIKIANKNFKNEKKSWSSWENFKEEFYAPKRLFKYYSNKTSINEKNYSHEHLETSEFYMVNPADFNDPFDCNIALCYDDYKKEFLNKLVFNLSNFNLKEFTTTEELIELFYSNESFFSKNCSDLLNNKIKDILLITLSFLDESIKNKANKLTKEPYKLLIKELSEESSENSCKVLKKNLLYKNNNFYLNDSIIPKNELLNAFNKSLSITLHDFFTEDSKFLQQIFRVSCFTSKNDSCLMWSHYANEHKGFCVEYSIEKNNLFLLPVIYNSKRNKLEKEILELVDHYIPHESTWKLLKDSLLTKSLEWKYENEWRLFFPKNNTKYEVTLKIKSIYLGCKMEENEKNKIIQILNNLKSGIAIYEMNLSTTEYLMHSTFLKKI